LLYTADLPTSSGSTTATFANDTAVLATDSDPANVSQKLQTNLLAIQNWIKKWRMKANGCKSIYVTLRARKKRAPGLNKQCATPPKGKVKYLELRLDRGLTWHKHIFVERKQLGITLTKMYWLLGGKPKLSTNNKLLLYKTILKPIWTYGIQLWGTAFTSNIDI
jgi:hypothetical protein